MKATTTMIGAALLFLAFASEARAVPAVVARDATNIEMTSATLNGRLTEDDGHACEYMFRYKSLATLSWQETSWGGSAHEGDNFGKGVSGLDPDTKYMFQCRARYSLPYGFGYIMSDWSSILYFTTKSNKPIVEALDADKITHEFAYLNGKLIEDRGKTCQYRFRYMKVGSLAGWKDTSWWGSVHEGDTFGLGIDNLDPDTQYMFQCQARYPSGFGHVESEWSNGVEFRTDNNKPKVVPLAATNVEPTTATLNGRLTEDRGGHTCQAHFRYRKAGDTAWVETAWEGSLHEGNSFSKNIDGLNPGTKYQFECQARYSAVLIYVVGDWSSALEFTTPAKPAGEPVAVTSPATNIQATSATLNGRLTEDTGHTCQGRFRWHKVGAGVWTETDWKGSLHEGNSFSEGITGLTASTQYEYQCQARYAVVPPAIYNEGNWSSSAKFTTITPPSNKPVVVTLSPLLTRCGFATLRGRLESDGGLTCQVRFAWHNTLCLPGSMPCFLREYTSWQTKTPGEFQAEIPVMPGHAYIFWAEAKNAAGTAASEGQTFTTPDGVVVPILTNKTKSEAEAALRAVGLVLGTVSGDLSGKVASQSPRAGTEVCAGSAVAITLSQRNATVPNVVGMSESEAKAAIETAGFVANVSYGDSDEDTGTVFKQDPVGGTVALQGSEVNLTVSLRPLAHWKLDESVGTIAYDAVGGHHGTVRGNPLWLPDGGMVDGTLWFDGAGDYVEIAHHADFDLTKQITVAAWVLVETWEKDSQTIIAKGDGAWRLQRYANQDVIEFACNAPSVGGVPRLRNVVGVVPINDGQWHHVAGTYDGATMCLYVDGVLDTSVPAQGLIATNNYSVRIGDNSQNQGRYWKGPIDDVQIYDEALNEQQIRAVMTGPGAWVPTGSDDIGTSVAGSDSFADGVYTVLADGADIWGYRDEFRYVHMAVTGDFEFSAHVLSLENIDPWSKAGVMVRETLEPESRHAFMCVTPQDGEGRFAFQCRPATAGLSTSLHSPQGQVSYPTNTWVKIKRQGNSFTALTSEDGTTWTPFPGPQVDAQGYPSVPNPMTIDMPETVYIGLAVTSHSNGQLCTAEFDNVQTDNQAVTP